MDTKKKKRFDQSSENKLKNLKQFSELKYNFFSVSQFYPVFVNFALLLNLRMNKKNFIGQGVGVLV